MKKLLFLLTALLLGVGVYAQNELYGFQGKQKEAITSKKVNPLRQSKNFSFQNTHECNASVYAGSKDEAIEPSLTIDGYWSAFYNVETGEEVFYKYNVESFYENYATYYTTVTMDILDDDLNVVTSFSFEMPDYTNGFSFEYERNTNYFAAYVHHFVGGVSFENQTNSVFLINDLGEVVHNFPNMTGLVSMERNKLLAVNFDDYAENYYVYFYNNATFEEEFSITISQEMTINLGGAALTVTEFEEELYIVAAYYEDKYTYDWETLTENNHLNLDFYTFDYQLVKEVDIPLVYPDPEDWGVFPMPAFGNILSQFVISTNIFNSDDKWEFVMPFFVDSWLSGSWYNFYVVNEDGEYLKSHNEHTVLDYYYTNELEGFDTQLALVIGEEEQDQQLQFFNIERWEIDCVFDAIHNGDLISMYTARIANESTFEYLIGLGGIETSGSTDYGIIKQYNRNGVETNKIRLPLTDGAQGFIPALNDATTNPRTFDTDAEMDYMYGLVTSEGTYVCFSKAEADEAFFVIAPDSEGRSTSTYGFFYDESGTPKTYYQLYEDWDLLSKTNFYDLPFIVSEDPTYIIYASVLGNGIITPSGEVIVAHGDDQTFTFTPDANHKVSRIVVDGEEVEIAASYAFENVTKSHEISVEFEYSIGLEDNEAVSMKIYPNPVQNELHIRSEAPMHAIQISDITGRTLYEIQGVNRSDLTIDVSGFVGGIYFVQIDKKVMKIIK